MIIHLGVNDVPYDYRPEGQKSSTGRRQATSTGDVAEILETKYGVMQFFWDRHQAEVVSELRNSIEGALETLIMGGPSLRGSPAAAGGSEVEVMFQRFLDAKEMDGQVTGVPTAASLAGVNHRFKRRKQGSPRPSFVDTGLYQSNFRCWVT